MANLYPSDIISVWCAADLVEVGLVRDAYPNSECRIVRVHEIRGGGIEVARNRARYQLAPRCLCRFGWAARLIYAVLDRICQERFPCTAH